MRGLAVLSWRWLDQTAQVSHGSHSVLPITDVSAALRPQSAEGRSRNCEARGRECTRSKPHRRLRDAECLGKNARTISFGRSRCSEQALQHFRALESRGRHAHADVFIQAGIRCQVVSQGCPLATRSCDSSSLWQALLSRILRSDKQVESKRCCRSLAACSSHA